MTDPGMKCVRCKGPAFHRFPQHNARFCHACLKLFVERQVSRAIDSFAMMPQPEPVLVAVSGGKDSLALWQVLIDLGYTVQALHLNLGLGDFSRESLSACQAMAERLQTKLHVVDLKEHTGYELQEIVWASRRPFCSVCGTMKRYWLNRLTRQLGFQVVATGHHLDDETGRLLGNMIRGHSHHLDRQWPMLPAASHLARRIKPLCRLSGLEIRAYVQALDLKPLQAKCVKARGATLPHYQEAMTLLEQKMPGTKLNFYLGFLKSKGGPPALEEQPYVCRSCGLPAQAAVCAGCNLLEQAAKHQQEQTRPDPLQPSLFKLTVGRK